MSLIFNFSAQIAEESRQLSRGFVEILIEIVEKIAPQSKINEQAIHHYVRKYAHFFVYSALGMFVYHAIRLSDKFGKRRFLYTILFCVLYAISDEIHQSFIPGRGTQVLDVLIDISGSLFGIALYSLLRRIFINRKCKAR